MPSNALCKKIKTKLHMAKVNNAKIKSKPIFFEKELDLNWANLYVEPDTYSMFSF